MLGYYSPSTARRTGYERWLTSSGYPVMITHTAPGRRGSLPADARVVADVKVHLETVDVRRQCARRREQYTQTQGGAA